MKQMLSKLNANILICMTSASMKQRVKVHLGIWELRETISTRFSDIDL